MASQEQNTMSLELLVDKANNRVILAESNKDFVDVLFSLLTLPIGTVVRLLAKKPQQLVLGCMNNLYKDVEILDLKHFPSNIEKTMLLRTRNSSGDECRKLKVNIDDTEPTKHYVCSDFSEGHICQGLSVLCDRQCGCGSKIYREIRLSDGNVESEKERDKGVFIKEDISFIITDDLQVIPSSSEAIFYLFNNLGVKATETFERKTITIGFEEVSSLLKYSLLSKACLTEAFLEERGDFVQPKFEGVVKFNSTMQAEIKGLKKISLKVITRKSKHEVVYAEAGDDFVNFLFSMLTFPLGSVVKLMDRAPLRCITNLYKSVEGLDVDKYMKSEDHKAMLLSPKLALQYGCKDNPLGLVEVSHPKYIYNYDLRNSNYFLTNNNPFSLANCWYSDIDLAKVDRFVTGGPGIFMITDDLIVTPFSTMSTISLLEELKVPINDIEMQVVSIGQKEALQILEASMTSNVVLTSLLYGTTSSKLPKQEKC